MTFLRWSLLGCGLLLSQGGYGAEEETKEPGLAYEVKVEVADEPLQAYLLEVSSAHVLEERKPASISVLRHRAEADLPQLREALRARGYYDGRIELRIEEETAPLKLVFAVEPGPLYRFGDGRIDNLDAGNPYSPPSPQDLGLVRGEAAEASRVLAAEAKLLAGARESAHALARLDERQVTVDHANRSMEVILRLHPGPVAKLGEVSFRGAPGVDTAFLHTLVPWKADTPYRPSLVEDLRQAMADTNLFATIRVEPGTELDAKGRLPFQVELVERSHRTFKASLGYNITKGPSVSAGWWHRNYFGAGERLSIEGTLSGIGYSLDSKYRKPSFYRPDQALVMDGRLAYEDTDAYTSLTAGAGIGLERQLAKNMTLTLGPAFRLSQVDDVNTEGSENFGLLSFPVKFDWDFSDNRLDASRGGKLFLQGAPYVNILDTSLYFGKTLGKYSHYYELLDRRRLVLAGRVALGSIFGAERDAVPADERFYAGGGGSIRGYGYQMAGPLNQDGKPIGGASLLELSAETRVGFTQNLGGVLFVDAGGAFDDPLPGSGGDFFVGVGAGMRYSTPIGPVRFDVGVPTKKRDGYDDSFQIYLSIGQAF